MKKDLNKLSVEELKKELDKLEKKKKKVTVETDSTGIWEIGQKYCIRTVTMINIGRLIKITEKELVLETVSWIADTGRFMNFVRDGSYSECEPFTDVNVIMSRGSIVDAFKWKHDLPIKQK